MVCGVCAGIAEYFNWDPTIVRLIWVGASLLFGAGFMGLIAYFIVAVIMPENTFISGFWNGSRDVGSPFAPAR